MLFILGDKSDKEELNDVLDFTWLKTKITQDSKRDNLEKLVENLDDSLSNLEGKKPKGFDSNFENLFELGISGLSFGSYYGPGVPFKRFSTGNYIFLFKSFYHHK